MVSATRSGIHPTDDLKKGGVLTPPNIYVRPTRIGGGATNIVPSEEGISKTRRKETTLREKRRHTPHLTGGQGVKTKSFQDVGESRERILLSETGERATIIRRSGEMEYIQPHRGGNEEKMRPNTQRI